MIPWRLFWVALGAVVTAALGGLLQLVAAPTAAVAIVAATATAIVGARWGLLGAGAVIDIPIARRRSYAAAVGWAAVVHAVWIVVFLLAPASSTVHLLVGLSLLAVSEYAVVVVVGWLASLRPQSWDADEDTDHTAQIMRAALDRAGYGHLKVVGHQPLGDDSDSHGIQFALQMPAGKEPPPAGATEKIAVALAEILKTRLESSWVQLRKTTAAGGYTITVLLRDVMADVIPYVDTAEPTSITQPALVGYGVNREPAHLPLAQHGQVVGKSRYGKSGLINVQFAHGTRCVDAVVWTCGVEKLYDLIGGWVEPYTNTDYPIPFDWVANGPHDTLDMLIAAMNVARWRQRQPMASRVGFKHIWIVLDEASFALRNQSVKGIYQGQFVTMSRMAAMISQGAGSGNVWLLRASQRSTHDHGGDHGADITANVGYSAAFNSHDWAEIGRLIGDFNLPMPSHKGEYWLDTGQGDLPVLLKAPYMQEVDPSKPRLHDGSTVSEVAWSRRRLHQVLDSGSAEAAGDAYRLRCTRMDDRMRAYLTGEPEPSTATEPVDPHRAGYAATMAALTTTPPADSAEPVATMVGRRTRADRILDIITAAPDPVTPQQILVELHGAGDTTASDQVVTNALTKLVSDDRVRRLERGRYEPADQTNKQTHTGVGR